MTADLIPMLHPEEDAAPKRERLPHHFQAIGVGQGDAFVSRLGKIILFDGGRSEAGFPDQFVRATGLRDVDVLIVSHNDADHANGALGFLNAGLGAKEVWLPGQWLDRLQDLVGRPEAFLEELRTQLNQTSSAGPLEAVPSLEEAPSLSRERPPSRDSQEFAANPAEFLEDLAADDTQPLTDIWNARFGGTWHLSVEHGSFEMRLAGLPAAQSTVVCEALLAAERIRRIALAAHHSGAVVRWFRFEARASQVVASKNIRTMNSREVLRVARSTSGALHYLSLSVANRNSLVFLANQGEGESAVLFSADSDLTDTCAPLPHVGALIVTAPHHGSESNAGAYRWISRSQAVTAGITWVRSDGRFRSRPGASYLAAPGKKFCTLCRKSQHGKQDVRLEHGHDGWTPLATRGCSCQP